MLLTGGWDATMKVWDHRASQPMAGSTDLPDKAYTMSVSPTGKVVVGMAGRHVHVYDPRNLGQALHERESSCKAQTRCIRANNEDTGYVLSTVEGRVAVEYFGEDAATQAKKYAFKCHRGKIDGREVIYPVTALAFHPTFGTFATGGCDGIVNVWDGVAKKRVAQFDKYPSSVAALSFNHDGTLLAVASSYMWEKGNRDSPPDTVIVRTVGDKDVRPRHVTE